MRHKADLSDKRLLLAAISIAGAFVLLVAALWTPEKSDSADWQPLNEQVEAALQESHISEEERSDDDSTSKLQGNVGENDQAANKQSKKNGELAQIVEEEQNSGKGIDGLQTQTDDKVLQDETQAPAKAVEDSGAYSEDGRLDINLATAAELDTLKGIGPAKAAAIVADREQSGKFKTTRELLRVKGIGQKLLSGIEDSIVAKP